MDRQRTTQVDPKARETVNKHVDATSRVAEQKGLKPQKQLETPPIEVEYARLVNNYRSLEERLYTAEKDHFIRRIVLSVFGTFGVYCCWACEWVNMKFLIAVSAICIAVVAATLGILWEKHRSKEVNANDSEATR